MRKHALLGGSGGMPLRKIPEFRTSEIASAGFSGQVHVAKIMHISSIQEALSLLFACGTNNYDKWMLGHKQKLLGHVPGCAGAWLCPMLNAKVCGSESAIFLLSCSDHLVEQLYLENGSSSHCHFIMKLMLITAQSITTTQRLHSYKFILVNKNCSQLCLVAVRGGWT